MTEIFEKLRFYPNIIKIFKVGIKTVDNNNGVLLKLTTQIKIVFGTLQ